MCLLQPVYFLYFGAGLKYLAAPGILEEALASGSMKFPEMETSYLLVLRDVLTV